MRKKIAAGAGFVKRQKMRMSLRLAELQAPPVLMQLPMRKRAASNFVKYHMRLIEPDRAWKRPLLPLAVYKFGQNPLP